MRPAPTLALPVAAAPVLEELAGAVEEGEEVVLVAMVVLELLSVEDSAVDELELSVVDEGASVEVGEEAVEEGALVEDGVLEADEVTSDSMGNLSL